MDKQKKRFLENVATKSPAWHRIQAKVIDGKFNFGDPFWNDARELIITRKVFGFNSLDFDRHLGEFLGKYKDE